MKKTRIMELRGTYKGGGGPDKTILLSAAKHDPKKFFVLVTYLRDPEDDEFQIGEMAKKMGVPDYVEVIDRSMLDLKCLFELNHLIKKHSLEIIHVHDLKTTLLGFLLKVLNPKIKIMHTAHGWIVSSKTDHLKQKLQYQLLKFYPLHIAVSNATKGLMVDSGIKPDSIKVLYNSIDTDFWNRENNTSAIRDEFNISDDSMIVGTVGRLSREKDLPTFFKVANKILEKFPKTRFLIIGDGKDGIVNELRLLSKEMGIEQSIIFTGHRTDLLNIYLSFDVFLMTSITEGLPNTALEAMALEVPVVSTNVGGVPELVEDVVTGFLCDKGDVITISDKVIELLGNSELRKKISKNARNRIKDKFCFFRRTKVIEDYYLELK